MSKGKNTDILTARVSDDLAEWTRHEAANKNLSVSGFIAILLNRERARDKGNAVRRIFDILKR
ncbi:MAG: hypothetical protein A2Z75_05335 [Chloroflexi bacterium RBG_13_50_10]|nr:MAG: hypothetical protein A2Z75_05335 [Chloroflexi bacterium RBG_13_50_10]